MEFAFSLWSERTAGDFAADNSYRDKCVGRIFYARLSLGWSGWSARKHRAFLGVRFRGAVLWGDVPLWNAHRQRHRIVHHWVVRYADRPGWPMAGWADISKLLHGGQLQRVHQLFLLESADNVCRASRRVGFHSTPSA